MRRYSSFIAACSSRIPASMSPRGAEMVVSGSAACACGTQTSHQQACRFAGQTGRQLNLGFLHHCGPQRIADSYTVAVLVKASDELHDRVCSPNTLVFLKAYTSLVMPAVTFEDLYRNEIA